MAEVTEDEDVVEDVDKSTVFARRQRVLRNAVGLFCHIMRSCCDWTPLFGCAPSRFCLVRRVCCLLSGRSSVRFVRPLVDAVYFASAVCMTVAVVAQEPNDTFGTASSPVGFTVSDSLDGGGPHPDTLLAVFADADFTTIDAVDDDSSPWGDGFASALGPVNIQPNGDVYIGVTGSEDVGFFGAHDEEGLFYLQLDIYDRDDLLIDQVSADRQSLPAGEPAFFTFSNPSWVGGEVEVTIDNQVDTSGPDQFDFWRFTNLQPGSAFSAEVTEGEFDSMIGWFDANGDLIAYDDDEGNGQLSKLTGLVPASGQVVVAVTGYNVLLSEPFSGNHPQNGQYTLSVHEIDADFNDDGRIDCLDIDRLVVALGSATTDRLASLDFDLNGDGDVDSQDIGAWLAAASDDEPLTAGDANLDGFVDVSDFNAWNEHRGSETVMGWCQGNFNADRMVDALDFETWNQNRFSTSVPSQSPLYESPASVPEPTAVGLLGSMAVALVSFGGLRKHRRTSGSIRSTGRELAIAIPGGDVVCGSITRTKLVHRTIASGKL